MKLIETTATHEIYLSHFQGKPVRFFKSRETGEMGINADDAAQAMGFKDVADLLSNDWALDMVNDSKNKTGKFPLFKI